MNILKKFILISALFLSLQNNLYTDVPHYIDFKFILNESKAGKQAQDFLKKKLNNGIAKIKDTEKKLQEEERKIIQQKKIIDAEEYKKQVTNLRSKVSLLQKERNTLIDSVAKQRAKARNTLLKTLNPLMKDYMKKKNIRMVLDKKSLLLGDEKLDITQDIIKLLNDQLKSIKLN